MNSLELFAYYCVKKVLSSWVICEGKCAYKE